MNQNQQPRPWWKDIQLVWVLVALVLIWLMTTTILFLFPLTTILSLFSWQSWDWRWLVLLGLIFLSAGVLYLTVRRVWNRLFDFAGFRGKTLWDWMALLMVPLVVGGLAAWFQVITNNAAQEREDSRAVLQLQLAENLENFQQEREDDRAKLQRESDDRRAEIQREIESDRARDSVLQSYIQDMTELLLNKGLATSKPDSLIRQVAHANTISAIHQLDSGRNGILLGFLSNSDLLSSGSVALLKNADLRDADLSSIDLSGARLSGARLSGADLRHTVLIDANLNKADLRGADLRGTLLGSAHLSGAVLVGADLSSANLYGAVLRLTELSHADLSSVILSDADLSNAILRGAKGWTNQQLVQAESLVGALLPDGTEMTEEAWEEFKKSYKD